MWFFKKRRFINRVMGWLKCKGCNVHEFVTVSPNDPDLIACINGKYTVIKVGKNSASIDPNRYKWRTEVLKAKGEILYATPDNFKIVKDKVRRMLKEQK